MGQLTGSGRKPGHLSKRDVMSAFHLLNHDVPPQQKSSEQAAGNLYFWLQFYHQFAVWQITEILASTLLVSPSLR